MKKIKLTISVVILVCLMLSLSGCGVIDDLRKTHAKYVDGYDKVELCGQLYKRVKVPDSIKLGDRKHIVYVTTPDVPLLLSRDFCEYAWLNDDRSVLLIRDNTVYVREDIYDDVVSEISSPLEYTRYCFEVNKTDDIIEYYYLSDSERDKINGLFESGKYNAYFYDDEDYPDYNFRSISVDATSDSGVFRTYSFGIFKTDDGYRVYLNPKNACLTDDTEISEKGDLVVYYSTLETDEIFDRFFSVAS